MSTAPSWITQAIDSVTASVDGGEVFGDIPTIDTARLPLALLERLPRQAIAQVLRGIIEAADPTGLNAVDIDGATNAVCAALMGGSSERCDVIDRVATVADEAFGPFPVLSPSEYLNEIERGIYELRRKLVETENRMLAMMAPSPDDLTSVGLGTAALTYHADVIDRMIAEIRRRRGTATDPLPHRYPKIS